MWAQFLSDRDPALGPIGSALRVHNSKIGGFSLFFLFDFPPLRWPSRLPSDMQTRPNAKCGVKTEKFGRITMDNNGKHATVQAVRKVNKRYE